MSKRDEFITVIRTLRAASPTITDKQHIGLLRQASQQYNLTVDEATEILKAAGLVIDEGVNYFEVLGFSITDIQSQNETDIATSVEMAHKKRYSASLRAGARIRPDGRTEEQWRSTLNQARDTLTDAQKRQEYLTTLLSQENPPEIHLSDISPLENEVSDTEPVSEAASASILSVDESQGAESMSLTTSEIISAPTISSVDVPTDMVIIPAGEFQMGSNDEDANDSEKPVHPVYIDAFYIDKYLVTNEQYKAFLEANPQWQKDRIHTDFHNGNYLRTWNRNNYPIRGAITLIQQGGTMERILEQQHLSATILQMTMAYMTSLVT